MKNKKFIILAASVITAMSCMTSFAGATGQAGINPAEIQMYSPQTQDTVNTAETTQTVTNGTVVENAKAAELINNFSAKLKAANNFAVNEKVTFNMTISDATKTETSGSITEGFTVVDGNNANITAKSTVYENGIPTKTETLEQFLIKDATGYKSYKVTQTGVEKEAMAMTDLRDNYFPIKYHGDETVTLENGEYVVKGFMTKEDYATSSIMSSGDTGMVDTTNTNSFELFNKIPYELHFNAETGNLTLMKIDMTVVVDSVMSLFKAFMGNDINMNNSMFYESSFNINPAFTFVIPQQVQAAMAQ